MGVQTHQLTRAFANVAGSVHQAGVPKSHIATLCVARYILIVNRRTPEVGWICGRKGNTRAHEVDE